MSKPLVSIIIPTYNRETLLLKALDSIFQQTFQDFEILIIDDASTDNTEQVVRNLNHEKIRYFRLDKNGGQCVARNYGIKRAEGDYIAFLDSDDIWVPEKLELQLDCFRKGSANLGCVYGYSYSYDAILDSTSLIQPEYYRGNIYRNLLTGFCPPTPSLFMVKKQALIENNGFDEKLITFVDLDMWLRLSLTYEFDFVERPLITKVENIGDQYVNNFDKRYNGIKLFYEKWKKTAIQKVGKNGFANLNNELTMALVVPLLQHPPANIRKNVFKLIKMLIDIRSFKANLYIKCLMIFLFGPGVVPFIRRIKNSQKKD